MANMVQTNHWNFYEAQWDLVAPPLRPTPRVAEAIFSLADVTDNDRVLMWGFTQELSSRFLSVEAIDKSQARLSRFEESAGHGTTATIGNWLEYPTGPRRYRAIVGDGSLNSVGSLDGIQKLLAKGASLLAPGGRIVCRVFLRPSELFSLADISRVICGEQPLNFHAFKWMLAMHMAETQGATIKVSALLETFNRLCPCRDDLIRNTGWRIDAINTIDVYYQSTEAYVFPSRSELERLFPHGSKATFHRCGGYDLSDCCPILTIQT